jgi:predicted deacylase
VTSRDTREVVIAGKEVKPGQRTTINIPVARLYTHAEMNMPAHVLRGKKDGPHLFVSAGIHGDEILGVEIVRRLLKLKKLKHLRGTLIAVPVVNVYGFLDQSRYSPDRRDLNRFFPGSEKGSLTSQLANIFMNEIVGNCTHGIDLHTASNHRINLPHIRANLDDSENTRLSLAFGAPVVLNVNRHEGSLRSAVEDKEIPMLLYEAGEALRFDEVGIRVGVRGILSVMRAIGMLPAGRHTKSRIEPVVAGSSVWARAPMSGIFHSKVALGSKVRRGSNLGIIADPFGENEVDIPSPESGVVIGRLNLPLVHRGDALSHIACVSKLTQVAEMLEAFQEQFEDIPPKESAAKSDASK